MKEFILKLSEHQDLTREEASSAMRTIMDGAANDSQIAGFLMALRLKGETPDELLGFVEVMRARSVKITIEDGDAIDMCGTGGDGTGTFNISTVASFVVAGAGVTVAKHGNRSISSACGSADVLKELSINIDLPPETIESCINSVGIGFLFAPLFHPAMKHAARSRADLGVKTCFNLLGPMTNPAGVRRQVVGAFSHDAARTMASVFARLDTASVLVLHSHDGLDEISLEAPTTVFDVNNQPSGSTYDLDPESFGLSTVRRWSILGGSAPENAAIAINVLGGKEGPHRDIVLANAALGLLVSGKARNIHEGVLLAAESIDSGRAMEKLHLLRTATAR